MEKIKNIIARTIKNIGKITAFSCLLLPAFAICCLLGSWTIKENNENISLRSMNDYDYNSQSFYYDNEKKQFISKNINNETYTNGYINVNNGVPNTIVGYKHLINKIDVENNTIYYINCDVDRYPRILFYENDTYISYTIGNGTFTTPNNCNKINFYFDTTTSYDYHIMITKGSSNLPYLPYGYIYNNQSIYKNGNEYISRNLLEITDKTTTETSGITYSINNGDININGISNAYPVIYNKTIDLSMGTYNISKNTTNNGVYIWVGYNNENDILNSNDINNTFILTNDATIRISIVISQNSIFNNETFNIMLNKGEYSIPYLPYGILYTQHDYDILNTNYQNLQNTYNNYVNNHSYTNNEYQENYNLGYQQATQDIINQYQIPIVQALQIQQVVIHAENSDNEDLGRVSFSIYEDKENNELELSNINTINGSTKNVIEIYLINNLQITEFKATEGFIALLLGNQRLSASYDGTNYIVTTQNLQATQIVNIIKIEINTNVRAVNYTIKGSNLSIEGQTNAYESGVEIGKAQQQDIDQQEINRLQTEYDKLLEHYNNAQLENPLSKMVISVADIPLNLFHNMFNFDIMGFNLSAFILGIITILLVAYVIKLFL